MLFDEANFKKQMPPDNLIARFAHILGQLVLFYILFNLTYIKSAI